MRLRFLSSVPPGPERERSAVCAPGASVSVCERIHLGNTKLCIIYQTAVGFVLVFTLRDRS